MFLRAGTAVLLLSGLVFAAHAQKADNKQAARVAALFKANDSDKNGKIEFKECFSRARKLERELHVAKDATRRAAAEKATPDVLDPADFLAADVNDNLALTRDELEAWLAAAAKGQAAGMSDTDGELLFRTLWEDSWPDLIKRFDTNKDKKLAHKELAPRFPRELAESEFAEADKNRDNALDFAECFGLVNGMRLKGLHITHLVDGWWLSETTTFQNLEDEEAPAVGGSASEEWVSDEPAEKEDAEPEADRKGSAEDRKTGVRTPMAGLSARKWPGTSMIYLDEYAIASGGTGGATMRRRFMRYDFESLKGNSISWKTMECYEDGDTSWEGGGGHSHGIDFFTASAKSSKAKVERGTLNIGNEKFESMTMEVEKDHWVTAIVIDGVEVLARRWGSNARGLSTLLSFPEKPDSPRNYKPAKAIENRGPENLSPRECKPALKLLYSLPQGGTRVAHSASATWMARLAVGDHSHAIVEIVARGDKKCTMRARGCNEQADSSTAGFDVRCTFSEYQFSGNAGHARTPLTKAGVVEVAGERFESFTTADPQAEGSLVFIVIDGVEIVFKRTDANGKLLEQLIGFVEAE